jgi:GAF domain-containing protein
MTVAPALLDEVQRLEALRRYEILDTPPEGSFDRVAALAAHILDVPIALVTMVDEHRIWFKSRHGLDGVEEIGRDPGLCASAILQDEPYIVEAAREDVRTLANPLVAGKFGLQFYAAAPLRTFDGYRLGTLCIIDRSPRMFSPRQADVLERLSEIVIDEMDLRIAAVRAQRDLSAVPLPPLSPRA